MFFSRRLGLQEKQTGVGLMRNVLAVRSRSHLDVLSFLRHWQLNFQRLARLRC